MQRSPLQMAEAPSPGTYDQDLKVITRTEQGFDERTVLAVVFVPMTGEAQGGGREPKPKP